MDVIRQGVVTDTDGTRTMVIWLDPASSSDVTVNISGAKPSAAYAPQSQCSGPGIECTFP